MFQIDYRSKVSVCDQIISNIIRLKTLGVLPSGAKLPSVRVLASKLSVNPNTVQKAYTLLETSGIICTVRGKGSFLCEDNLADSAIKEAAKKDFRKAVKTALDLGLNSNDLIEIINAKGDVKE
ncbi:MAG: GntR family transcriptional regulator [Clostridia bacterium]|nr:GntR family transcriptional regulator [Clostridia bacterium]